VSNSISLPTIAADDFSRRFSLRAGSLMWFLGAGASASAGIPTAWDMIWEFKQKLYISQRRVSPSSVADLTSAAVRAQLQAHADSSPTIPSAGDPEEYAALFEAVYPAEADRRTYLDGKFIGAKPSYGILALATLMQAQHTRMVWTTNFDPLLADACAKVFDTTGTLTTAALDAPELAEQAIGEGRWPIEIKLHGDFRSRRLKNTSDELRHQDARLRGCLVDSCQRFGLVVAGYSGRDNSIMDALEDAISKPGAFPGGLFWLHRGEAPPLPRVVNLLVQASNNGVEAGIVPIENLDEALRDSVRLIENLNTTALDNFANDRRRWSGAPEPQGGRGWPVIRLNALPIVQMPTVCRRIVCNVGGHTEARAAVDKAGVSVLVGRVRAGVLAFGSDASVRKAFEEFTITEFGLHTVESKRLRYDSGERGLLRAALAEAIARNLPIDVVRRRSDDLLAPSNPMDGCWQPLRKIVGPIDGTVEGCSGLTWREGLVTRLDWANERLWLVFAPRVFFDGLAAENKGVAASFARERTVKRYNRPLNELITFWANLLASNGDELRALGVGDGVDAVFRLSGDTAFSRRATA